MESARDRLAGFARSLNPKKAPATEEEKAPLTPTAIEKDLERQRRDEGTKSVFVAPPQEDVEISIQSLSLNDVLDSPFQPRKREIRPRDVEELGRLIAANGQTTPIIVTPGVGEHAGKYYVHSGHRRCAAMRGLGWTSVKAIVRNDLSERDARKLALTDNLAREDLCGYEQAAAFADYCAAYQVGAALAAEQLGLTKRHATRLQAISKASAELLELLRTGAVSARAAEPLVKLEAKEPRKALRLAKKFNDGAITVAEIEAEVVAPAVALKSTAAVKDVDLRVEKHRVRLALTLPRAQIADGQLERVREAMATLLGHIGVERLDVAAAAVVEESAS